MHKVFEDKATITNYFILARNVTGIELESQGQLHGCSYCKNGLSLFLG